MNDAALYTNIISSILKQINDFRTENMAGSTYFDWDAHAQADELPEGDLIGPAGCGMTHEESGIHVVFGIGVATGGDPNLFRMRALMSKLYGLFKPQTSIPILDADTGDVLSWMVIRTPVSILPAAKAQIRSVQFFNATALIDPGATSSLR
ncbi:MAG: hypothetical protein ACREEW_13265 [Caulobacteraceae bacterium]